IEASAYPYGLVEAHSEAPLGPLLYTGALENHPRLLAELAWKRRLWGNGAAAVRSVRSPEKLARVFTKRGLPCPFVGAKPHQSEDRKWLSKPRKGAAGRSVRHWKGEAVSRERYLQEWIEGDAYAAVYVGRENVGQAFRPDRTDLN